MNGFHVHIGTAEILQIAPAIIIFGFFWRVGAALAVGSNSPRLQSLGQGMAFIF